MGPLAGAFHSADEVCVPVTNRDTGACGRQEVGILPLTSTQSTTVQKNASSQDQSFSGLDERERTDFNLSNKVHQGNSFANGFQSPWFASALFSSLTIVGQSMTI